MKVLRAFCFLLAATLVGACERQVPAPTVESVVQTEDGPDQETWDPTLFLSEEGLPRVHLRASYMAYYDRGDSTYMVLSGLDDAARVRVDIFDAAGDSAAVVHADEVTFFDRERRMEARGNVIAIAREGRRIESEQLRWSEFERVITTPGFARIDMPDQQLEGYGLVADEDITNVRLRNVTGIVLIDEDEQ
ncbi:MAG: LPS export ABC transporter periplasmic protein LptC [Rhodothermales bacterium]|nr:LPS export ABC transporter periplasmic protein LptC [Rhodothermales bacterium]MBO6779476.1 LPS export ABC transporter periplasmic protein LptC [Rhodothermales bacterium]